MAIVGLPRLLPLTVAMLGTVLALKAVVLAGGAVSLLRQPWGGMAMGSVSTAQAAVPDKPPAVAPPPAAPSLPAAEPAPISEGERAVLLELRKRRQELDAHELGLTTRESVLAAAEQRLTARVEELAALQKKLEALEAAHRQREDAGWQGLVKLYETMKPRDAATIFNELQMPVLLSVLDRMKEAKAAPIVAAMNPDKARDVTARLAETRTRRENPGAARGGS